MMDSTIKFSKIPVMNTAKLAAYMFFAIGLVMGLIIGLPMLLINLGLALAYIILFPIAMVIVGAVFGALYAFGTNYGFKYANGLPVDVSYQSGQQVVIKKLYAIKYGIVTAFQWLSIIIIPLVLISLITMIANIGAGIMLLVIGLIGTVVVGFIFGIINAFGINVGLGFAKGYPVNLETTQNKSVLKSVDVTKTGIVLAASYLIFGILLALIMLLFYGMFAGMIDTFLGAAMSTSSLSSDATTAIAIIGIVEMLKSVLLIGAIILPIALAILGFISGLLIAYGVNLGFGKEGYPIGLTVSSAKLTVNSVETKSTAKLFAFYYLFAGLFGAVLASIVVMMANAGAGILNLLITLVLDVIIGLVMGFALKKGLDAIQGGYVIEGENLNFLLAAGTEKKAKSKA
ncbi:MAG: hypothetical protein WC501_02620 [Candidatus Micrarchaeia archaeon]